MINTRTQIVAIHSHTHAHAHAHNFFSINLQVSPIGKMGHQELSSPWLVPILKADYFSTSRFHGMRIKANVIFSVWIDVIRRSSYHNMYRVNENMCQEHAIHADSAHLTSLKMFAAFCDSV